MAGFSDEKLIELGEVLFGLRTRVVRNRNAALAGGGVPVSTAERIEVLRQAVRRAISPAPQVVVKITGGGKGAIAIGRHFDYLTRHGEVPAENEFGEVIGARPVQREEGADLTARAANRADVRAVLEEWKVGGSGLPDESHRKEAFNLVLSMPEGTPREAVRVAARAFAREEFARHSYLLALHTDTNDPHVHLVVRAEGFDGRRLNPRKADLQRWRDRFAEQLQTQGIEARAERQFVLGNARGGRSVWQDRRGDRPPRFARESSARYFAARVEGLLVVAQALTQSGAAGDAALGQQLRQRVMASDAHALANPGVDRTGIDSHVHRRAEERRGPQETGRERLTPPGGAVPPPGPQAPSHGR